MNETCLVRRTTEGMWEDTTVDSKIKKDQLQFFLNELISCEFF